MIEYRFATEADNTQLLNLTASSAMAGKTPLRVDRKPDFFRLLHLRGESMVIVAVKDNSIIGSLSISLQHVYIDANIYPVYYVADFRVSPQHRGSGVGIRLCEELEKYTASIDADLIFVTVAKGNTRPLPFFKNRPGIPDFLNIGSFAVHQFIGRKASIINPEYKIEETDPTPEVIDFLNDHYRQYQLGSVITDEKLALCKVVVIKKNGRIISAMCIFDAMDAKQNVVLKITWPMMQLLHLLNAFSNVFKISKLPLINEPVRMMYIRYIAAINYSPELVRMLIGYARNLVYQRSYSFISIGVHEKDPLREALPPNWGLTFYSSGMLVSLKNDREMMQKVKDGVPFEDYSLV